MHPVALALALSLSLAKGHGPWLREYVGGGAAFDSPEAQQRAEVEARRRAHFAWREGEPHLVDKLRLELEATLAGEKSAEPQRLRAARVLGWMRQPASVPALAAALAKGPPRLREEAAQALRHFGALEVKYPAVSRTGAVVQERLEPVADPRATLALVEAAKEAEPRVRRAALRALAHHGGEGVVSAALAAGRAGRDAAEAVPLLVRTRPADLEPLLLAYAASADEATRAAGARGLGQAKLASARARLLALLDDPSAAVFAAAHAALRELEGFPPSDMPEDVALDRALLTARWRAR